MGIKFYVSKCGNVLNKKPWNIENIVDNICLNPSRQVKLCKKVNVLLDSGAFQDVDKNSRLTFSDALDRQLGYEKKLGFKVQRIVSYDQLVDEQVVEGRKIKRRVDPDIGQNFVDVTIQASKFLVNNRMRLTGRQLVLSCQGVSVEQYIYCLGEVLNLAIPSDCIGLGGFCVIGNKPKLIKQFLDISKIAFPMISKCGISDIHLFGVTAARVLLPWYQIAKEYDFNLSIDSSAFERRSIFGEVFRGGKWYQDFTRIDKYVNYHPNDLGRVNILSGIDFYDNMQ